MNKMKLICVKCKDFDETQFLTPEQKKIYEKFRKVFDFSIQGMRPYSVSNIWHGQSNFGFTWESSLATLPDVEVFLDFSDNPKGILKVLGYAYYMKGKSKKFPSSQCEQAKKYILDILKEKGISRWF